MQLLRRPALQRIRREVFLCREASEAVYRFALCFSDLFKSAAVFNYLETKFNTVITNAYTAGTGNKLTDFILRFTAKEQRMVLPLLSLSLDIKKSSEIIFCKVFYQQDRNQVLHQQT